MPIVNIDISGYNPAPAGGPFGAVGRVEDYDQVQIELLGSIAVISVANRSYEVDYQGRLKQRHVDSSERIVLKSVAERTLRKVRADSQLNYSGSYGLKYPEVKRLETLLDCLVLELTPQEDLEQGPSDNPFANVEYEKYQATDLGDRVVFISSNPVYQHVVEVAPVVGNCPPDTFLLRTSAILSGRGASVPYFVSERHAIVKNPEQARDQLNYEDAILDYVNKHRP